MKDSRAILYIHASQLCSAVLSRNSNIRPMSLSLCQVKLSRGVRAHWLLLKQRLKKICNMDGAVLPLWSARPAAEDFGPPFLLSVSSYDQQGFLHGRSPLACSRTPGANCLVLLKEIAEFTTDAYVLCSRLQITVQTLQSCPILSS